MEKDNFSVKNILLNIDKSNACRENLQENGSDSGKNEGMSKNYKIHKPQPIRPILDTPFGCSSFYGLPKITCTDASNVRHSLFDFQTSENTLTCEKRKRSWSRAVFSNLQRKGLERQFEVQKYITKPDRKKLAQRLNLSDSQVKVWFQNRRMKERHRRNSNAKNDEKQEVINESDEEIDVLKD